MGIFKTIENSLHKKLSLFLAVIFLFSCKDPFEPNLPSVPQGYLVVEGFINADGPTEIRLSRSTPLEQKKTFKAELNASVKIEGDDNSSFVLSNMPNGIYTSNTLPINSNRKYRLRIKTKDTREYLSDFAEVKITPAIDSISWKEENSEVQIYANTHDPQNKTIYYRWDYDETWEIRSTYYHYYKYSNGSIVRRDPNEPDIFFCWKYDTLKTFILYSSEKLEKDIVYLKPLVFIPLSNERVGVRYSIQVRQYALDKEAYQFYELLKKNTESLGSIFDPQPSVLKGNIHSLSDPNELIVGYIGVTSMQQQRIFINQSQIAGRTYNINTECDYREIPNHRDSLAQVVPPGWPFDTVLIDGTRLGYKVTRPECVDCRLRGGSIAKPNFW